GWNAARPRNLEPDRSQPLEQIAIEVFPRFRLATGLRARRARPRRTLRGEYEPRDALRILQQSEAFMRQNHNRVHAIRLLQQLCTYELFHVAAHFGIRHIRQQPECAQPVVPAADNLLARLAAKHARDVGCAEPLANTCDARQDLPCDDDRFGRRLELVEAEAEPATTL